MSALPSASKLELAEICEGSAVLEGVETTDMFAELGTEKHRFLARALEVGREKALAEVPDKHRSACAVMDLEQLPAGQPGAWAAEVAYAFDVDTGIAREIGRGIDRRYTENGIRDTEIPGTIDLQALSADGEAVVPADYKTGYTRVTRAQENLQLLFAAVCASLVYRKNAAQGAILYPGPDGDQPYFDTAVWDAFDLDAARLRLIALGKRIIAARRAYHEGDPTTGEVKQPRLVVGKHCRYCPAITTCPAQGRFIARLVHDEEKTLADLRGLINTQTAHLVYNRIKAAKLVLDRAEAVLYAYAANNPIPLSDGRVLGKTLSERESLDAQATVALLGNMFGAEVAKDAVEFKATKASVKRSLVKHLGAAGKKMTRFLKTLRESGGVHVKTKETVKEFFPGVQEPEEGEEAA